MAPRFDVRAYVRDLALSMNTKDPHRVLAHYSDDAEVSDPSTLNPLRGRAALERSFRSWVSGFSELALEIEEAVQSGDLVAMRLAGAAKHTGSIELRPGEVLAPTHRIVRFEVANFLTLDEQGKIRADRAIFDVVGVLAQLDGATASPPPAQ